MSAQLQWPEETALMCHRFLMIQGQVSESVKERIRGGLPHERPENAAILFIGFAYADIPIGRRHKILFPKDHPEMAVAIDCEILAVTQQYDKPFDYIPRGWKTICLVRFIAGIPEMVRALPLDGWFYPDRLCLCDEDVWRLLNGIASKLRHELQRIRNPKSAEETTNRGAFISFIAKSSSDAKSVIQRVESVVETVDDVLLDGQFYLIPKWTQLLPQWLTSTFARIVTREEEAPLLLKWNGLSPEEKAKEAKRDIWSFWDWLHWMRPECRNWYWIGAEVLIDQNEITLTVEAGELPIAWGSLRWLFKAAGATSFEPVADDTSAGC